MDAPPTGISSSTRFRHPTPSSPSTCRTTTGSSPRPSGGRKYSADCVRLIATDEQRLRQFALNKARDDIDAEFQDIAGCLLSPHYDVFAIRENLQRTLDGETERGKYPLCLFALLQPTIFRAFRSVVIMGACFEESLPSILWGSQGVKDVLLLDVTPLSLGIEM
jgi:hypothetical protein